MSSKSKNKSDYSLRKPHKDIFLDEYIFSLLILLAALYDFWDFGTADEYSVFEENLINSHSNFKTVDVNAVTPIQSTEDNIESFSSETSTVPIVLSHFKVQFFIESLSKLPESVFKIKASDRNIYLSKCELDLKRSSLLLKGVIQENIQYTTANHIDGTIINGNIKKLTLNTPFECSKKITFNIQPNSCNVPSNISNCPIVNSTESLVFPSEKVYCKINNMEVYETNIYEETKPLKNTLVELYTFDSIRKKLIVTLELSLMQNQKLLALETPAE